MVRRALSPSVRAPALNGGAHLPWGEPVDSMIETLANPRAKAPAGKSRMDAWLDTLPEARREAVLSAAINRSWGHTALYEALREYGAPEMSDTSFGVWRRKKGLPRVS